MGYLVDRTEFTLRLVQHTKDMLAALELELRSNGALGNPGRQLYHLMHAGAAVRDVTNAVRRTMAGVDQPPVANGAGVARRGAARQL